QGLFAEPLFLIRRSRPFLCSPEGLFLLERKRGSTTSPYAGPLHYQGSTANKCSINIKSRRPDLPPKPDNKYTADRKFLFGKGNDRPGQGETGKVSPSRAFELAAF
ncbi:MAG: hypothetical protein ABIG96_01540, partial [Candidatus Micrarchaeota archaeon]